jgi:hypothetical protein
VALGPEMGLRHIVDSLSRYSAAAAGCGNLINKKNNRVWQRDSFGSVHLASFTTKKLLTSTGGRLLVAEIISRQVFMLRVVFFFFFSGMTGYSLRRDSVSIDTST